MATKLFLLSLLLIGAIAAQMTYNYTFISGGIYNGSLPYRLNINRTCDDLVEKFYANGTKDTNPADHQIPCGLEANTSNITLCNTLIIDRNLTANQKYWVNLSFSVWSKINNSILCGREDMTNVLTNSDKIAQDICVSPPIKKIYVWYNMKKVN